MKLTLTPAERDALEKYGTDAETFVKQALAHYILVMRHVRNGKRIYYGTPEKIEGRILVVGERGDGEAS